MGYGNFSQEPTVLESTETFQLIKNGDEFFKIFRNNDLEYWSDGIYIKYTKYSDNYQFSTNGSSEFVLLTTQQYYEIKKHVKKEVSKLQALYEDEFHFSQG